MDGDPVEWSGTLAWDSEASRTLVARPYAYPTSVAAANPPTHNLSL